MHKLTVALLIITSGAVFAELPIPATQFRKAPVEEVMRQAGQAEPEAQLELALRYYAGHQVARNAQEAFNWMGRSAERANPEAQYLLSRMYAEGIGTAPDADKEEAYFARALGAQPDNAQFKAQYEAYLEQKKSTPGALEKFIARCAGAGYAPAYIEVQYPVATNLYANHRYDEALPMFRQLAAKGDPEAIYWLARMYAKGQGGLAEDNVEAFSLYERAANKNHAEAQYTLAVMYAKGHGVLKDEDKAVFWYGKAALNGQADAQYQFARSEFKKALFWLEESQREDAEENRQKDADEVRRAEDLGKYRRYLASAVGWYKKAAEQNHRAAQYTLGRLHASGEGVVQNFPEAVRLYDLAAAQGHAEAHFYLGLMHQAGLGVQQDIPQAIKFYEKAADKKVAGAQFYLGNCYRFGIGVAQDLEKGRKHYETALNNAIRSARDETDPLKKLLDPKRGLKQASQVALEDEWISSIAREYGIGLWRKSASETELENAKSLVGKAAQNGDVKAQEILLKMNTKERLSSRRDAGALRPEISENKADARADAVRRMRPAVFMPVFLQQDVKTLYPRSGAEQDIRDVQIHNKRRTNVAGEGLWELYFKVMRPTVRNAADLKGVTLIGVEFTDRQTGRKFFGYVQTKPDDAYNDETSGLNAIQSIFSIYANMNPYPEARLTGWAIVYGHMLQDETILAVFDSKSKNRKTLIDLFRENANSKWIELFGKRGNSSSLEDYNNDGEDDQ